MNLSDLKKKYSLHVLAVVAFLGVLLVANAFIGEGNLVAHEDQLRSQQDYLITTEEAEEPSSLEGEALVEDIIDAVEDEKETGKDNKVINVGQEDNGEVTQEEQQEKQETQNQQEETTTSQATSTPTIDRTPITGNQYVVKANDTLFFIAQRANVSVENLKRINNLNSDNIVVGQVLTIKASTNVAVANPPSTEVVSRGSREDDLYWLSRIIHAEAQGEPYLGKVAVGNVVLNRVKSSDFPNTIYGVVFDRQHGYTQFSPVIDGSIYNTPNADSVRAAQEALNGARPIGNALYFLNPRKATNFWIVQNRKFSQTIGDHDFYH